MEDIQLSCLPTMPHSKLTGEGEKKVKFVSIYLYYLSYVSYVLSMFSNDSIYVLCSVIPLKLMVPAKQKIKVNKYVDGKASCGFFFILGYLVAIT